MAKSIYEILIQLEGDQETKRAIEDLGKAVGLSGAALTAFSSGAAKLAMDYEKALGDVSIVIDEQTGTTEELSDALFQLQQDMGGAINVQEGAVAATELLSSGIKGQAAILAALEKSQKAAIAGQSDLNTVSSAAAGVVNAYGDALGEGLTEAEKFDKVVNLMLQTQIDGVITADQYARSIGGIAAGMKLAGLSIEQVNAIIAVTTAKGIPAASAFTNLNQAVSNIQKPSKMAADEAARMGIQFDAARLQAVGLDGILKDMVNSGKMQADTLAKMFESTEARNSIAVLIDNLDDLDAMTQRQIDGMGALSEAFNKVDDTRIQQITNTMNLLQGSLIKIGQGALIAFEPVIKLVSELATMLSELPPEALQIVGVFTAVLGVTLTLNGAVLLMAASYGGLVTTIGTLTKFMTAQLIPTMGKLILSTQAYIGFLAQANISLTALLAKAAIAVAPFVALGAAVVALNKHMANMRTELENLELQGAMQETDKLAQKATSLGLRIEQTGKAIPDAEFNQWIGLLEQANEGNGTLTGIIDALKAKQEAAKTSTKGLSDATEDGAQTAEDAAAAYEDYAKRVADSVALIDKEKANALASISGSESEQIRERVRIEEEATNRQIQLLEDLKNQSGTTAAERLNIEADIQSKMVALNKTRLEANEQLEELHTQYLRDAYSQREAELEAFKARTGATILDTYEQESQLLKDIFEQEKGFLQAKIDAAAANSAERQGFVTELAEVEAQYLKDSASLHKEYQEAVKQAAEDRLQAELEGIDLLITKQADYLGILQQAQDIQMQYTDNANSVLDTQSSMLERISSALEDQNFTLDHRRELLALASEITGQSIGIEEAQGVIQQQLAQIEQRKLDLKIRQLEIERQQLATQSQIKQLEIQGERQQIASKLASGTLSENEAAALRQRDNTLGQQSALERQMAALRDQGLSDSIAGAQLEKRLQEILGSSNSLQAANANRGTLESVRTIGNRQAEETGRVNTSNLNSLRQSGLITSEEYNRLLKEQTDAANKKQEELAREREKSESESRKKQDDTKNSTERVAQLTEVSAQTESSQLETLNNIKAAQDSNLQLSQGLNSGIQSVQSNLPVVIDRLSAISQTASVISRQVDFVQKQLANLPAAISRAMPRPAPPKKN